MNFRKLFIYSFLLLLLLFHLSCHVDAGNDKYWVFLKDKQGSAFNPYDYFDRMAIERRIRMGIDLFDRTDWPVSPAYLARVESIADSVSGVSRWFNAIAVWATP